MDKFIKHAHSHLMVKLSNSKLTAERVIIADCVTWNNDCQNLGSVQLLLCMWKKKIHSARTVFRLFKLDSNSSPLLFPSGNRTCLKCEPICRKLKVRGP